MTHPALPALSLCLALILAACGTPVGQSGGEAAYFIGPEGAANLTAETPFTVPALERAFLGLDVVTIPDADMPAFHVREAGSTAPLYVVTPDWTRGYAGAVATTSPDVAGPGGVRVGASRLADVPEALKTRCAPPPTVSDIGLVCESPHFRLEFRGTGADPLLARQTYLPPVP
ncbi:hypothetical protein BBF93_14015 [Hyphomonas sp. CACIAM 19H1]|uniref:hypothetical protein n=1 Tax=Hyphomonas sp. CACIAM 19H1 TaxID=1873716 RepID=UPI000DED96F3|nr:hypothetical protein [Hyphomonas sp. CACIAM 19H1]AXE65207.1 hypothetical protein BBF93_14015 [Hyphomonas sp. CACIAM 19H1]